jgi:hypothetical protein
LIIKGKAVFTCPKTGKEVTLHKECTNADGKGNNCEFFKHWMWESSHPLLACGYGEKKENVEERTEVYA